VEAKIASSRVPVSPPQRHGCPPVQGVVKLHFCLETHCQVAHQACCQPNENCSVRPEKPAAGVMVARPAMAPDAAPRVVGLPSLIHSMADHMAMPACRRDGWPQRRWLPPTSAARAEPTLKAEPAKQSRPVPSRVSGRLCGSMFSRAKKPGPEGPMTITDARASGPAGWHGPPGRRKSPSVRSWRAATGPRSSGNTRVEHRMDQARGKDPGRGTTSGHTRVQAKGPWVHQGPEVHRWGHIGTGYDP